MLLPLLSEKDLKLSGEGSIDPLELYPIADSLATKMIPGIRERQRHPRFLTTIAVSLYLTASFEEDTLASDGVSAPWQVFEWYVVEGLVRQSNNGNELTGLPGIDKTRQAINSGLHLSASRYLKTPSVFGFNGVYRVLSKEFGIDKSGSLGEAGYLLLSVWEKEQKLTGFLRSSEGLGAEWRNELIKAINDGLKNGAVSRPGQWNGWELFQKHLNHYSIGIKERDHITQALLDPHSGYRKHIFEFLISKDGKRAWSEIGSEKIFHETLLKHQGYKELQNILNTILIYEKFARLLTDAFEDCLFTMSRMKRKTNISEFYDLNFIKKASKEVPNLYADVINHLTEYGESYRFNEIFSNFSEQVSTKDWVEILLAHHERIQKNKPPDGKAPWFERFDDGGFLIRSKYIRDKHLSRENDYVNSYRTNPLWSFSKDLKLID